MTASSIPDSLPSADELVEPPNLWNQTPWCPAQLFGWIAGLTCAVLAACAAPDDTSSTSPKTIVGENRLNFNRLALNRLALNRLALNRLALNRLALNRLALNGTTELDMTEEGREVLKYVAQCALRDGDVLVAEHEGVTYEFPGLLGLAPQWEDAPLQQGDQRMLSACLLAHVNAFGVSVPISLRDQGSLPSSPDERIQYSVYEGTFFGQVFEDGELKVYSCQGSVSTAALEHSEDRALRVCTDGTGECAIVPVGRCLDVCEQRHPDEGWVDCWANGVRYRETVSVYLFADDPDGKNQRCTTRTCKMNSAIGNAAILDCNGKDKCDVDCESDATCSIDGAATNDLAAKAGAARFSEIDCYGNNNCLVECRAGASCDVDCQNTNNCKVTCENDALCDVHCGSASGSGPGPGPGPGDDDGDNEQPGNNCDDIKCRGGASCLIACNDVNNCGFSECYEGAESCPGDVIVCGRPCP
jgi:hypothetical protein